LISTLETGATEPTWSNPESAHDRGRPILYPQLAVDEQGNSLVIYLDYDRHLIAGFSNNFQDIFTIAQVASPQVATSHQVETLNGDEVTSRIIEAAIAQINSDKSFIWNKAVALSEASGLSSSPQVAVDSSGRAVAIWRFVEPNSSSASIQCKISNNSPHEWVDTVVTLANNVKKEGYQSVAAAKGESDLALAYWSTENKVQIYQSHSESPSSWSEVINLTDAAYFASPFPSLDATIFVGKRPEVIWS